MKQKAELVQVGATEMVSPYRPLDPAQKRLPGRLPAWVRHGKTIQADEKRQLCSITVEMNRAEQKIGVPLLAAHSASSSFFPGQSEVLSAATYALHVLGGWEVTISGSANQITRFPSSHRLPSWAEENFRSFLDAVPDAMLVVDGQARIVLANAQAETLFRCERDQLLGKPIEILIPERFRSGHPDYLKGFFADSRMRPMGAGLELHALRFDGEEFPVEISLSPLATQTGTLAIGVVRDIGERQQAEKALDEYTARLRAQAQLLDLAHDAIFVRDKCGVITYWNREAEQTYGWSRSDALGKVSHALLQTVYPRPLAEIEAEVFYKGQWEGELLQVTRSGRQMVVAGRWAVQTGDAGEPNAILEINRDISESKHTEERIKSLNLELHTRVLELAASNQELESFSYSVSHDLRAPLRQVDGFTKILLDHKSAGLDNDARECLLQIRQGTLRMARLVDDLLNFSRLGRQELRRQTVDLGLLVADVVNEFRQQTRDRDVRWTVDNLSSVECDPQLMKQVFVNLVSNAVKFTQSRQPAVIEIGHDHKGKETIFWIKDNGVGFDMKYADKLFGVFQRLHLQEEFEGTGVGLANVHRIIHKHGGRIWANASLGAGATFSFTLGGGAGRRPSM